MLGIRIKFECPDCGNVLSRDIPASTVQMMKRNLEGPSKCSCGRVGNFRMLDFKPIEFEVKLEE